MNTTAAASEGSQITKPKPKTVPTEYLVLRRQEVGAAGGGDVWLEVGKTSGVGTPRSVLEKWAKEPGTYKLVAASAWRHDPVTFAEQTGIVAV